MDLSLENFNFRRTTCLASRGVILMEHILAPVEGCTVEETRSALVRTAGCGLLRDSCDPLRTVRVAVISAFSSGYFVIPPAAVET